MTLLFLLAAAAGTGGGGAIMPSSAAAAAAAAVETVVCVAVGSFSFLVLTGGKCAWRGDCGGPRCGEDAATEVGVCAGWCAGVPVVLVLAGAGAGAVFVAVAVAGPGFLLRESS